jgi:endonuclease YncB( thermonuclease family)
MKIGTITRTFLVLILIVSSHGLFAQLSGKVVSVADGDTFTLLTAEKKQIRIRLHGIDCPEKKQDYGEKAKQFLADLVFQKVVTVIEMDTDRYGRTIGMVTINEANVNKALLKAGLAWHYKQYDKNPAWAKLEQEARQAKRGLWSQPNYIAPWDFRHAGQVAH